MTALILKITAAQANAISARDYSSEALAAAIDLGMTWTGSIRGRNRENGLLTIPAAPAARAAAANFFATYGQLSVDCLRECDFSERGEYVAMRNLTVKVGALLGVDLFDNRAIRVWELELEASPA